MKSMFHKNRFVVEPTAEEIEELVVDANEMVRNCNVINSLKPEEVRDFSNNAKNILILFGEGSGASRMTKTLHNVLCYWNKIGFNLSLFSAEEYIVYFSYSQNCSISNSEIEKCFNWLRTHNQNVNILWGAGENRTLAIDEISLCIIAKNIENHFSHDCNEAVEQEPNISFTSNEIFLLRNSKRIDSYLRAQDIILDLDYKIFHLCYNFIGTNSEFKDIGPIDLGYCFDIGDKNCFIGIDTSITNKKFTPFIIKTDCKNIKDEARNSKYEEGNSFFIPIDPSGEILMDTSYEAFNRQASIAVDKLKQALR